MPEPFGASYRRADLLRRVGRPEQVAGVRLVRLEPGEERGYVLEIGALPGPAAIGEFEARVSRLAASGEARAPGEGPATRRR